MRMIVLLLLVVPVAALARLNDTRDQAALRYGQPVSTNAPDGLVYHKAGIRLTISFNAFGRADSVVYVATNAFREAEALALLQLNFPSRWMRTGQEGGTMNFNESQGQCRAALRPSTTLHVFTAAYHRRRVKAAEAETAAKARARTQGF